VKKTKKTVERTPIFHTVSFTTAERRKIDAASRICGWGTGEGPAFAKQLLMTDVQAILHRETPGERLRRRLATVNRAAA
jgi:hypothetical protein